MRGNIQLLDKRVYFVIVLFFLYGFKVFQIIGEFKQLETDIIFSIKAIFASPINIKNINKLFREGK